MTVPSNLIPTQITRLQTYGGSSPVGWVPYVINGVTYKAQISQLAIAGSGTVTSVNVFGGTTGLTFSGGPITESGLISMSGTLVVPNGGTGHTTYGQGQLLIGNAAGGLTKATITAGANVSVTNGDGTITIASTGGGGSGTVTSVHGTGTVNGITLTGTVTSSGDITLGGALSGVNLTSQVTGTLPVVNGGTGVATTPSNGQILIGNGTNYTVASITAGSGITVTPGSGTLTIAATSGGGDVVGPASSTAAYPAIFADTTGKLLAQGSITGVGNFVLSNNATMVAPNIGTPASGIATNLTGLPLTTGVTGVLPVANGGTSFSTYATGDILYASATNVLSKLAVGSNTNVLTLVAGVPAWAAPATAGTVTSVGGTGSVNGITLTGTVTSSGNLTLGGALSGVSLTTQVTGTLPVANGGTGITSFGTGVATALGQNVNGSGAISLTTSPVFITPALGTPASGVMTNVTGLPLTTGVTGTLPFGNGGTGQTSYTDGQLLIGNTATGGISKATLTQGSGVTITNGNGTITIAATGGGSGTVTSVDGAGGTTGLTLTGGPITTTGTLTLGGTLIAANGGTGFATYAVGDLVQGATSTTLSKLAAVATGNVLISGGVTTVSSWGKVGLTTHVSGVLPVANGGTNASSASITAFNNITGYTAAGATGTTSTNLVFSTSPTLVTPALGTPSALVLTNATGLTAAGGGTGQSSYAIGDLLQASATSTLSKLASVATGNVLISGGVTTVSSWGKVGLTTHVSGTLAAGNGGTGITALGTGVATALGVNVGSAGAFVTFNGAGGTPSSLTLTNATGLPIGSVGSGVASAANVRVGTSAVTVVAPSSIFAGAAEVTITYSATTTIDLTTLLNGSITLTGNVTFANPSAGMDSGRSGVIRVIQDATGSRTVAFGGQWKFAGGTPTASTAANTVDIIAYYVATSSLIYATYNKAFA